MGVSKEKSNSVRGKKFGALTPVSKLGKTSYGKKQWKCLCDCGKYTKSTENHLKSGARVSCGCQIHRKKYLKDIKDLCIADKFRQYVKGAKYRKYSFNLTKEEFGELIFQNCHYCDSPPSNIFSVKSKNRIQTFEKETKYNGVDRVNNNKGYHKNNCVPCCKTCNTMKMKLSKEEFLEHISKIYENSKKKET